MSQIAHLPGTQKRAFILGFLSETKGLMKESSKLTAGERESLPKGDFALPGRRYPIEDKNHARAALSRVSQHGTPEEKAKVRAAVHRSYPDIGK